MEWSGVGPRDGLMGVSYLNVQNCSQQHGTGSRRRWGACLVVVWGGLLIGYFKLKTSGGAGGRPPGAKYTKITKIKFNYLYETKISSKLPPLQRCHSG